MNSPRRAARNSRGRGLARCCEGEARRRRHDDTLWEGREGRGGEGGVGVGVGEGGREVEQGRARQSRAR